MKRSIDVVMDDGRQVGMLRYDLQGRRENAAFEYSAGWLGDETHFALGPTLPLLAGPQFHRKLKDRSLFHAVIADTEPDGWGRRIIMRNHGFLHADRNLWRLSPAFDINPSPERVRELKTWISHDTGPDMTIDALMSVIAYFRITLGRAKEMLSQVVSAVEDWRKTGHALGMTHDELDPFADAFEHVERAAAKKML